MSEHNDLNYRFGRGSDEAHRQDQALFAQLLDAHTELTRESEKLTNGIRATTTTQNAELAKVLKAHVVGMEKRFKNNRAIRSWDPLFAALFEFKDQMCMEYTMIFNGVSVELTAEDPKLIELIHCHDLTIHGFVDRGREAGGEISPKPDWLS